MSENKPPNGVKNDEIIKAFDRELAEVHQLHQRHTEEAKNARARDRQVLIERRRHPR